MNILVMILLISLLILVHEFGHYAAARLCGIRVSKFGFGLPFGPTLFEKKIGDTVFCIHAFLLGGYVSFPDDEEDSGLPADSPELFKNKSVGQRAFVASAGVAANVICAIFLVLFTAFVWGKVPSNHYDVSIVRIVAPDGASVHQSGLKPGDKVVSINGVEIFHPVQINLFALASKSYDGSISPTRLEERLNQIKKLNPKIQEGVIPEGKMVVLPPSSDEDAVKLSRTEMFGIHPKKAVLDIILSSEQKTLRDKLIGKTTFKADGKTTLEDVAIATSDTKKPLTFVVSRGGELVTLNKIYPDEKGIIGIERTAQEVFMPTEGFKSGVINSCKYLYSNTETMIWSLGQIFTGKIPLRDMHGIVAITKVGGDVIQQQGLFKGLLLTAMISLNLAIVNLLPIPALDGGHLLFLLVEKIRGRSLNEKVVEKIGNIGFYLLIVLMIFIIFNDVVGLVTNKF